MKGMSKLVSLSCLLFLTANCGVSGAPVDLPKDIFILAGQSNMAGRGGVSGRKWDGNVPPESKPNPSILRLNGKLKWVKAYEPLHTDIDLGKTCGVGPGMSFANKILRTHGSKFGVVGLVPCAVGGTRIDQWAKGTWLYDQLLIRANESLKEGGAMRAILWYQGESDTVRKKDAGTYKANLEKLIMDLRSDLNIPNLLLIQVLLGSGEGKSVVVVSVKSIER